MISLADIYVDEGKDTQGEALLRQTLAINRRVLGTGHPLTLASMNNLATIYDDEGKYAQAEALDIQTIVLVQGGSIARYATNAATPEVAIH